MTDHLKTVMAACYEFRCAYCARPLPRIWAIEHIIPRCRGGSNDLANLTVSCNACNARKGSRTALEFQRATRVPERARRIATLLSGYSAHERDARCVVRRIVGAVRAGRREGAIGRG